MNRFLTAIAVVAVPLGVALSAQANTVMTKRTVVTPVSDRGVQLQQAALPPWARDDRSSSDYPIPMPGDRSGDALNAQYRDGIPAPPGMGLPAR